MKYRWLFPPIVLVLAALSLPPAVLFGQPTYKQGMGQEPILGPMRSSYIPLGPGDKMIATADLDGSLCKRPHVPCRQQQPDADTSSLPTTPSRSCHLCASPEAAASPAAASPKRRSKPSSAPMVTSNASRAEACTLS